MLGKALMHLKFERESGRVAEDVDCTISGAKPSAPRYILQCFLCGFLGEL